MMIKSWIQTQTLTVSFYYQNALIFRVTSSIKTKCFISTYAQLNKGQFYPQTYHTMVFCSSELYQQGPTLQMCSFPRFKTQICLWESQMNIE